MGFCVNVLQSVLDTILPARCLVCNAYLAGQVGLCEDCAARLEPVVDGQMIHLGQYRGHLERVARALKFGNQRAVAVPLGQRLAAGVTKAGWTINAVVPVPIGDTPGICCSTAVYTFENQSTCRQRQRDREKVRKRKPLPAHTRSAADLT